MHPVSNVSSPCSPRGSLFSELRKPPSVSPPRFPGKFWHPRRHDPPFHTSTCVKIAAAVQGATGVINMMKHVTRPVRKGGKKKPRHQGNLTILVDRTHGWGMGPNARNGYVLLLETTTKTRKTAGDVLLRGTIENRTSVLLAKIAKYIGFCFYRKSYLLWVPRNRNKTTN